MVPNPREGQLGFLNMQYVFTWRSELEKPIFMFATIPKRQIDGLYDVFHEKSFGGFFKKCPGNKL